MRATIFAVGRLKAGPSRDLFHEYQRRLTFPLTVREVEEKRNLPVSELKRREGELLLGALPPAAKIVVLDERGKVLTSAAFAAALAEWTDAGHAEIAFVIGGADGLHDEVRRRADLILALGAMTWPHQLVRVLLAEQLFRAQSIWSGHPYHRG
jgi:23S rRNA (pseudouridine1915-N3)-methyltransferase